MIFIVLAAHAVNHGLIEAHSIGDQLQWISSAKRKFQILPDYARICQIFPEKFQILPLAWQNLAGIFPTLEVSKVKCQLWYNKDYHLLNVRSPSVRTPLLTIDVFIDRFINQILVFNRICRC